MGRYYILDKAGIGTPFFVKSIADGSVLDQTGLLSKMVILSQIAPYSGFFLFLLLLLALQRL